MQPLLYSFSIALLLTTFASLAASQESLTTRDWKQAGDVARTRDMPVVMLVTGHGCGHCERLKSEFLSDPTIQSFLGRRALVRVYDENTGAKITDFDGERVRARTFLSRYEIFATPTLLFLDANGQPLTDPLVGYSDAVNYRDLLTGRLDQAQLELEAEDGGSATAIVVTTTH